MFFPGCSNQFLFVHGKDVKSSRHTPCACYFSKCERLREHIFDQLRPFREHGNLERNQAVNQLAGRLGTAQRLFSRMRRTS